jgi:cytochrome c peroxidase
VLNAALQNATFHDLRTPSLEAQITAVVSNREEMHGSLAGAAANVAARPAYAAAFAEAYGAAPHAGAADAVTPERLRAALAAYLRSLVTLDAPFDRYVRGDRAAMEPAARRGFTVFMGKGKCGTCHFAPLFNGAVPPLYQKTESEVLGVPARVAWRAATVDPDVGRMGFSGLPVHRHAFKTPTLRNVARTAPYMHNGVYRTLAEVVEFYDRGGGAGIGVDLPNQTLPPEPLHLTRGEKRDLLAFLDALTDVDQAPPAHGATHGRSAAHAVRGDVAAAHTPVRRATRVTTR